MLEPYDDDPTNAGLLRHSPAAFAEATRLWGECGYQVNTHAIGDYGNRLTLDVYEELFAIRPDLRELRFRIEHAQVLKKKKKKTRIIF